MKLLSIKMKTEDELCHFLGNDLNKIEKLCRICLSDNLNNAVLINKDSGIDIEDVESLEAKLYMDRELSLWEKIVVFGKVKVKYKDGLLKYICEQCCNDIDVAYTFRIKCHKAETLLKKVLKTLERRHNELGKCNIHDKLEFIEIPIDIDKVRNEKDVEISVKQECTDLDQINEFYLSEEDSENDNNKFKKKTKSVSMKKELKNKVEANVKREDKDETFEEIQKQYFCEECNKGFNNKCSLIKHIHKVRTEEKNEKIGIGIVKGHGPNKRIHCIECDYSCNKWSNLKSHLSTHTGLRPYKCDLCNKTFTQHSSLYAHKKRHSDKMFYSCEECGKQFKHRFTLARHQQVHSDECHFKCNICNKGLKTQRTLDEHVKRHLQIKNYSCEICGKGYVSKPEMLGHMWTHNKMDRFKCELCMKNFQTKRTLNIHMQRHSGDRQFECNQCEYAGYTPGELKMHIRTHTKEKNYSCPICERKFTRSTSLNKHVLRTHGEKFRWRDTVDMRIYK